MVWAWVETMINGHTYTRLTDLKEREPKELSFILLS